MKYTNGNFYDGEWANNKKNGIGKYYYAITNEIYEGSWVNNKKEGKGKAIYAFGDVYEGFFANNNRNGYGVLKFKDGS